MLLRKLTLCTLYCCLRDIDSVHTEQILNDELQSVNLWLSANKSNYNMLLGKHKNTHLPELKLQINNSNALNSISWVFIQSKNYTEIHIQM